MRGCALKTPKTPDESACKGRHEPRRLGSQSSWCSPLANRVPAVRQKGCRSDGAGAEIGWIRMMSAKSRAGTAGRSARTAGLARLEELDRDCSVVTACRTVHRSGRAHKI